MSAAGVAQARAILNSLGAIEAARILSVPIDRQEFLTSNRLDLTEDEVRELMSEFRA